VAGLAVGVAVLAQASLPEGSFCLHEQWHFGAERNSILTGFRVGVMFLSAAASNPIILGAFLRF